MLFSALGPADTDVMLLDSFRPGRYCVLGILAGLVLTEEWTAWRAERRVVRGRAAVETAEPAARPSVIEHR